MSETITPNEPNQENKPTQTQPKPKRKVVIIKGVIYDKDELEKQQKEQEEQKEQQLKSNKILFPCCGVNIYLLYLLIMIINIFILQWGGIFTGMICCILFGLLLS